MRRRSPTRVISSVGQKNPSLPMKNCGDPCTPRPLSFVPVHEGRSGVVSVGTGQMVGVSDLGENLGVGDVESFFEERVP